MENIIVILIVLFAASYLGKKYWNSYTRSKDGSAGCGCSDCKHCAASDTNCSTNKN